MGASGRWLALGVVAALVAWVLLRPGLDREIDREFLEPYAAALRAEEPAVVRQRWVSEGARARQSEVVWLSGQARNRDEFGPPRRLRLAAPPEPFEEEVTGPFVRVRVVWEGEIGEAPVVYDLVKDDAGWQIGRSWFWPERGIGIPRVF